jgi:hypothetical protein
MIKELLKLYVLLMVIKLTLDLSKLPFNSTVGLMEIVSMVVWLLVKLVSNV